MTLVLDSSVVVDLERGDKRIIALVDDLKRKYGGIPIITFITYFELFEGLLKRNPKNKEDALKFLNQFIYLHVTKKTAEILAELKVKYSNIGINLPLSDFLIAAQVKENNLLLITRDAHFKQIEEINKIILN